MCKVHNPVGSLTVIKTHLQQHQLDEYKSLNELINFQRSYAFKRQGIISNHTLLLEQEKAALNEQIAKLDDLIKTGKSDARKKMLSQIDELKTRLDNLTSTQPTANRLVISYVNKTILQLRIVIKKRTPNLRLAYTLRPLKKEYKQKDNRYQYILTRFNEAVMLSSRPQLQDIDRRKSLIDEINSSIYGAQGEQKVVKELEKLPDDYILINDFTYNFRRYIYSRKENEYIKSIQIDHILVAPSGIFIIETKNWSQESLVNPMLYSPVNQIKRTNFALYRLLNGGFFNLNLWLYKWPWGERKFPTRNLVVFINHKPARDYDYVKMLSLNELLGYITYFKPCFSKTETQMIADYLLRLNRG